MTASYKKEFAEYLLTHWNDIEELIEAKNEHEPLIQSHFFETVTNKLEQCQELGEYDITCEKIIPCLWITKNEWIFDDQTIQESENSISLQIWRDPDKNFLNERSLVIGLYCACKKNKRTEIKNRYETHFRNLRASGVTQKYDEVKYGEYGFGKEIEMTPENLLEKNQATYINTLIHTVVELIDNNQRLISDLIESQRS